MTVWLGVLIIAVILLGVPLWVVSAYNRLITLHNLVDNAWAQVDVQLKRRYDLIPNLVETVKGYAAHERQTFEKVIQARATAISAKTPHAKADADNALTGTLKSLFAVAEAYPDLKANQSFSSLQQELTGTEGFIAECRTNYNNAVTAFNTGLEVVPANAVAAVFKLAPREYFGVPETAQRDAVKVQF